MSPQLGGNARHLESYVKTLRISDDEPLVEYYIRALHMHKEITLQKDATGQANRLNRRFVSLLFAYAPFVECLRPVMTQMNIYIFYNPTTILPYFQ